MAITYDAPATSDNWLVATRTNVDSRKEFPFIKDLTAIIYIEDFVQRPDQYEPLALDTLNPYNGGDIVTEAGVHIITESGSTIVTEGTAIASAYLVDESDPILEDDGLFRFTRTFASVPATRVEFERTAFNFPAYKTDSDSTTLLRESFNQSVVSKVTYTYLLTSDPGADLTITARFQPIDSASNTCNFVASNSTPTLTVYAGYVTAGTYVQARETEVSRWMGNIWQMKNVQVVAL